MSDSRFQFQPWYVKSVRWLTWRPVYCFVAAWQTAIWAVTGFQPLVLQEHDDFPERNLGCSGMLRMIWTINASRAHYRMGWYWDAKEVFAQLKEKAESTHA